MHIILKQMMLLIDFLQTRKFICICKEDYTATALNNAILIDVISDIYTS